MRRELTKNRGLDALREIIHFKHKQPFQFCIPRAAFIRLARECAQNVIAERWTKTWTPRFTGEALLDLQMEAECFIQRTFNSATVITRKRNGVQLTVKDFALLHEVRFAEQGFWVCPREEGNAKPRCCDAANATRLD